ncbi:MAG: 30S ribosomal protein S20 [Chlamydiales bacterium]|nr:30S ribosomal protein S20 [Chlamydiales bacterium]
MADAKEKKTRRPTAQKRDDQSKRRNLRNKVYKSRVKTAVRHLDEASKTGDANATTVRLNEVYSLMDKGVKKGIFNANAASRTKSRITQRIAK